MAHSPHYRAWRDGFHGREPASACTSYLAAYSDGLRDGDRTRASLVARAHTANASAVFLAPAADVVCDVRPAAGCISHVTDEGT